MALLDVKEPDMYAPFPALPTTASDPGSPRVLVQVKMSQIAIGVFTGMWAFAITAGIAYAIVQTLAKT